MTELSKEMVILFLIVLLAIAVLIYLVDRNDVALMSIFGLLLAILGAAFGVQSGQGKA